MKLRRRMRNLDLTSPSVCKILSERLNKFCEFLDDEYQINSGGCCWITYCIAELLEKSNIYYSVELCSYNDIEDIIYLNELEESVSHYFLSITDSEGEVYYINQSGFESDYTIYDVDKDDILHHYKIHDWCCSYNHSKNKIIKSLLKTFYIDLLYDVSKR